MAHEAGISAEDPDMSLQDPELIYESLEAVRGELLDEACRSSGTTDSASVAAVGVTGQVHGVLYVDSAGHAASPLYTWQDLRGRRAGPGASGRGLSWASWAREQTGYALASGYGLLTHAINANEHLVPGAAIAAGVGAGVYGDYLTEDRPVRYQTAKEKGHE